MVVPWPHIVSKTGVTVDVAERARVSAFARRVIASGNGDWFALPGLATQFKVSFGTKKSALCMTKLKATMRTGGCGPGLLKII